MNVQGRLGWTGLRGGMSSVGVGTIGMRTCRRRKSHRKDVRLAGRLAAGVDGCGYVDSRGVLN
jgi:hypothetical protein